MPEKPLTTHQVAPITGFTLCFKVSTFLLSKADYDVAGTPEAPAHRVMGRTILLQ